VVHRLAHRAAGHHLGAQVSASDRDKMCQKIMFVRLACPLIMGGGWHLGCRDPRGWSIAGHAGRRIIAWEPRWAAMHRAGNAAAAAAATSARCWPGASTHRAGVCGTRVAGTPGGGASPGTPGGGASPGACAYACACVDYHSRDGDEGPRPTGVSPPGQSTARLCCCCCTHGLRWAKGKCRLPRGYRDARGRSIARHAWGWSITGQPG